MINPDESELIRHARTGEVDGTKEYPPLKTQGLSDHEKQIIYEGKTEWMKYTSLIEQHRTELADRIHHLQNQHESENHAVSSTLAESLTKEIEVLDHELGTLSAEYRHHEDAALLAKEEKHKIEELLGRPLQIDHTDFYVPALVILAIAEVPINRLAFELFFESMPLVSLLISAAIGGLLIFFAHTIGVLIKRLQCKEIEINRDNIYLTITLLAILTMTLMYFLGLMREKWVDVNDPAALNLESFINSATNTDKGIAESFLIGSRGFTLLLLNLAIFTVGIMLAFLRHDPHPFYEKAVNAFNKAQEKFLTYKRKYESKKNDLVRMHNKRLTDKRAEIKIIEDQIKSSIRELDGIDKKITTDRKNLISALARKVMAYQHSNQKIRKTPPPDYFKADLVQMIEELI
jgi:hypothetical protein